MSSVGFEIERLSDTLKDTLKKDGLDQIDRIYMAFGHSKSFFSHRHQRKFVAADMSFLKGAYKG